MNDELRRWRAHDPGSAVDEQNDDGVPHLERAREEEHPPGDRCHHEQALRNLDEPAAVVPIGERARVQREQQKRHPVADDREPGERRRVERLEDDPVANDMLDVVGHHREEADHEVSTVGGNPERGEPRRRGTSGSERLDRRFHALE